MKISIIGAGMVGSTVARNLSRSMSNIDEIVLLDIKDKLAEGKAIDINQCEPRNKIIGCTNDYSKTKNSDIVIITSGTPRKPGQSREELVSINYKIVSEVVNSIYSFSTNPLIIVVSNPVDILVTKLVSEHFDKELNIIGFGNELDSARFRYYITKKLKEKYPDDKFAFYSANVFGAHSDSDMIPIVSKAKIFVNERERKISDLLTDEEISQIRFETKTGGATITKMLGTSAWEAPAYYIEQMVSDICNGKFSGYVSIYDFSIGCAIGTYASITKNGVISVENTKITCSEDEKIAFKKAVTIISNYDTPTA